MFKTRILGIMSALLLLAACTPAQPTVGPPEAEGARIVVATTFPVYTLATAVVGDADGIDILPMLTDAAACLHDYSLTTADMALLESADVILISGAGLEPFLDGVLNQSAAEVIDCSVGAALLEGDPHYWLDPSNAAVMARNIGAALGYDAEPTAAALETLAQESRTQLQDLSHRELITFHDGFAYLARSLDLTILRSIEEEDGATASARELAEIIALVQSHELPAIFTELYGSTSAAGIISSETGVPYHALSTLLAPLQPGQSGLAGYQAAFEFNVATLREALQ